MLEVALQLSAIFTTWSKLGLFTPHPLLSHGNTCYYSQIILNSLPLTLFSELFWHNYLRPIDNEFCGIEVLFVMSSGQSKVHKISVHLSSQVHCPLKRVSIKCASDGILFKWPLADCEHRLLYTEHLNIYSI